MRPLNKEGFTIIGPGEFIYIRPDRQFFESRESREQALAGESTFHVWGVVRYSEIFQKPHSCKFSLWAQTPKVERLSFGKFGNDVEDDEE